MEAPTAKIFTITFIDVKGMECFHCTERADEDEARQRIKELYGDVKITNITDRESRRHG